MYHNYNVNVLKQQEIKTNNKSSIYSPDIAADTPVLTPDLTASRTYLLPAAPRTASPAA